MKDLEKIRHSIIDAAAGLFGQYGYEKTSIDEIAKTAHKAKTSVYYHFDSKLSIFKAVLEREFSQLKGELDKVLAENAGDENSSVAEYLKTRFNKMQDMVVYRKSVLSSFVHASGEVAEVSEKIREEFDEWEYGYFNTLAEKGRELQIFTEAVSPDAFARMMNSILRGLEVRLFYTNDYEAMRSTYESMVELLIFNNTSFPVGLSGNVSRDAVMDKSDK